MPPSSSRPSLKRPSMTPRLRPRSISELPPAPARRGFSCSDLVSSLNPPPITFSESQRTPSPSVRHSHVVERSELLLTVSTILRMSNPLRCAIPRLFPFRTRRRHLRRCHGRSLPRRRRRRPRSHHLPHSLHFPRQRHQIRHQVQEERRHYFLRLRRDEGVGAGLHQGWYYRFERGRIGSWNRSLLRC